MRHFFLWAVAISALCSSCETADESIFENQKASDVKLENNHRTLSDYDLYTSVVSSFEYNKTQSHYNNQLEFEQHVNNSVLNGSTYEAINFARLSTLEHTDATFVSQLMYSTNTKAAIVGILNGTFIIGNLTLITDTDEQNLIMTLYALHNDGNGDDEWKNNRTIAFAYGAQHNLTQAILYAGTVNLVQYKN
ncbi:hypothetical protein [Paenimyroides baculatum]|uniref:Uncharacterized protein n=1 Tax=Paenimyroides baculatum TaxID=2608000 RepID=A0A5M6CIQ6_9FLAO|nr:hypothetical protein [Paenimyroides baculatum]KAA5532969.1 hypothetical protein F0460_11735 [Paenimyroides baculatum]